MPSGLPSAWWPPLVPGNGLPSKMDLLREDLLVHAVIDKSYANHRHLKHHREAHIYGSRRRPNTAITLGVTNSYSINKLKTTM